jgi:hypothetical protein
VTFQQGGPGGTTNTLCRSTTMRLSTWLPDAWTVESTELALDEFGGYALVDFPQIIGTGPGQIPPGANITSAQLEL